MSISNDPEKEVSGTNEPPNFNYEGSKYYGVGGWLLLLCIGLTIIGPFMRLGSIGNSFAEVQKLGGRFPSLATVVYLETVLGLILIGFSVCAGTSLWSVKTNAVYIAKAFLAALVIFSILDLFLILMAGFPEPLFGLAMKQGIIGIVQSLIYSGVWFAYLNRSVRVRNTYKQLY